MSTVVYGNSYVVYTSSIMSSSSSNSWLKAADVDVDALSTDQIISLEKTSVSMGDDEVFLPNDHEFDADDEADPIVIPPPPPPIRQVPIPQVPAATTTGRRGA